MSLVSEITTYLASDNPKSIQQIPEDTYIAMKSQNQKFIPEGKENNVEMEAKLLNEHHDSVLTEKNTVNLINIDSKEELCEPSFHKLEKATSDKSYTSLNSVKSKEKHLIEEFGDSKEDNKLTMTTKITGKVVLDKNHLITSSKNENMTSSNDYPKPEEVLNGLVNSIGNNVENIDSVNKQLQDHNINNCSSSNSLEEESGSIITKEMLLEEEKCKNEEKKTMDEVRMKTYEELQKTGQRQRYDRLEVLLSRSKLYATYLLGRVNARQEAEKKKQERLEKLKKMQEEKKAEEEKEIKKENEKNSPKETKRSRRLKYSKTESKNSQSSDGSNSQETNKKTLPGRSKGRKGKKRKVEETKDANNFIENSDEEDPSKKQRRESNLGKKEEDTVDEQNKIERTINGIRIPDRQPLLLTGGVMRDYQLDGMEWLKGLFEHGINGILADEMGLGKTIQSIALITTLIEQKVLGPYMIAAPLSTLPNWVSEFKKFAPEVYTVLYHGTPETRAQLREKLMRIRKYSHGLKSLPVVISSYEMLMRDRPLLERYGLEWKYLIVDEGHRLKNLNCKLIRELKLYRTANRLLLTGTPLQNNLSELWSLLNFLLPDIFDDLNSFQSWFDFRAVHEPDNEKLLAQEQEAKVLQTLHSILTPFLLRRLKTDVDLSIPPKKEVIVYAPLTAQQENLYKTTLDRTVLSILKKKYVEEEVIEYSPAGRVKRKASKKVRYREYEDDDSMSFDLDKIMQEVEEQEKRLKEYEEDKKKKDIKAIVNVKLQNVMMLLRKCCNHPHLVEYPYNPETEELIIDDRVIQASGKMLMLDRMIPELIKQGHKILIFSQMTTMLDIIGDYCGIRNYKYSRIDGSMKVVDRQENIESFNNEPDNHIFLLSTRAGGLGLNLMIADTCIIYDSDWNPQCDLQAQDRCHRIGQKKPVVVYRLITANTIDQRIIERAGMKRRLEKMVIHKNNFKGHAFASAISPTELLELLRSNDVNSTVDGKNIISDAHLQQLLDRSDMETWKENQKKSNNKGVPMETVNQNGSEILKRFEVVEVAQSEDIMF